MKYQQKTQQWDEITLACEKKWRTIHSSDEDFSKENISFSFFRSNSRSRTFLTKNTFSTWWRLKFFSYSFFTFKSISFFFCFIGTLRMVIAMIGKRLRLGQARADRDEWSFHLHRGLIFFHSFIATFHDSKWYDCALFCLPVISRRRPPHCNRVSPCRARLRSLNVIYAKDMS